VTARAIRFYEDKGLITPLRTGTGGRVRVYAQRDRTRLALLLRGKRLGLALSEIKDLLDMYETSSDTVAQLSRYLALLGRHREALRRRLTDMHQLLDEIDQQRAQAQRVLADLLARGDASEIGVAARENAAS
jgi:DNA-binding transcriptional MerR regulator